MGATAFGALGVISAGKAYAEVHRTSPLQFYGGFASGVRPDLARLDHAECHDQLGRTSAIIEQG